MPQPRIEDELHDFYEDKIFDFISEQKITNERKFTIVSKLTTIKMGHSSNNRSRHNSDASQKTTTSNLGQQGEV